MATTVFGLLGTNLDSGKRQDRWTKWRPSVAVCQHEELLVNRFVLIHQAREAELAEIVAGDIQSASPETTIELRTLDFSDPWDFEEVFTSLHGLMGTFTFQPQENYLVHITTGTHVQQICLFLLAESRHLPGRLLQTSPPPRHLAGEGSYRIIDLDLSRYDAIATRFAQEQREGADFLRSGIKTVNTQFNTLIDKIEQVAIRSQAPLLLTGPTGAGKSQLARRIFELKRRRQQVRGEFVEVNCATLRGDQAMSALFGHVKGAFTGATGPRPGLLKSADKGLLFLDEIGELGLDEQAMLLRAVEEKRFLPVGSDKETASDFQLIAGTNRDLLERVREGCFREDLLARINLWTFQLPGLAERREDIAPNLDYELERFAAVTGHKVTINKEARDAFLKFGKSHDSTWPANFRDLNAAVTRMATLARSGRISLGDVEREVETLRRIWKPSSSHGPDDDILNSLLSQDQLDALDLFDRLQLAAVVKACRESASLSDAGRKLFAVTRKSKAQPNDADRLRKYLARYRLSWEMVQSGR